MKKILLIMTFCLTLNLSSYALTDNEIPAGYVKLHSGAIVPIEDVRPASNKYLNVDATPHEVYTTPATDYNPYKNKVEPKFTGFW